MEVERNARWCGSPAGIRDARASLRFARLVMRQRPAQPTTTATREPPRQPVERLPLQSANSIGADAVTASRAAVRSRQAE